MNMAKKYCNASKLDNWINFKRGLIASPRCSGCDKCCVMLYDSHHDQYFSANCGLVVMEMGVSLIDFGGD